VRRASSLPATAGGEAFPSAALRYDTNLGGYRTNITEGRLRDAPEFSDDSWEDRDWEARTHEHYGVPGYWGT
jgi:hypothetical protein